MEPTSKEKVQHNPTEMCLGLVVVFGSIGHTIERCHTLFEPLMVLYMFCGIEIKPCFYFGGMACLRPHLLAKWVCISDNIGTSNYIGY